MFLVVLVAGAPGKLVANRADIGGAEDDIAPLI